MNFNFNRMWQSFSKRIYINKSKHSRRTDCLITFGLLAVSTLLAMLFFKVNDANHINVILVYILSIILIAYYTNGYLYGIIASVIVVTFVNYIFTYPYFELNFTITGYPFTFLVMLIITLLTGTTTTHLMQQNEKLLKAETDLIEADKEKMRANLLRAVSHDLRTPLTTIIGASSSYLYNENSLTKEELRELVSNIYDDSNWLLNMVENLLSVTRIHRETSHVNKSPEPIEEVVSEAVGRLKKRLPNAKVEVCIPEQLIMIPMDPMLIEQVIINLLENAIVHSQSESAVKLLIKEEENDVVFSIRDYGVGIEHSKLDTIFEGATESDSRSVDSRKGMGIGLSICKTIVAAHGGDITAKNYSDGAEITFKIPKNSEKHQSNNSMEVYNGK